ncbi:MAG: aldehyde ferredoxin oxidoreductase C-terminal domain-containing protein [Candidatus Woesearchaeota archaeon]
MKNKLTTLKIDLGKKIDEINNRNNYMYNVIEKNISICSLEEKLGGFGKAIHDINSHLKMHPDLKDAYDPRNMVSIDIGFLTGSKVMTGLRTIISGLSPLKTDSNITTNGIYYSASSGDLGKILRGTGFDSIQLVGKLDKPSYLVIKEGTFEIKDATELIGKSTDAKIRTLASNPEYEKAAFAVIGPSGEKRVRFANIAFSTKDQLKNGTTNMRYAGRGGMGAVLGSKNILGIVAVGELPGPDIGDITELNKETGGVYKITNPKLDRSKKYREQGTFFSNNFNMEALGAATHRNFYAGTGPLAKRLFRDEIPKEGYGVNDKGCTGCGIRCWKEITKEVSDDNNVQTKKVLGKIDYEPGALLGVNLGINDLEKIMSLIEIVDLSGLDSISAGVSIGYEMERLNKFGDYDFAKDLLLKIANNEHGLSEGTFRYAKTNGFTLDYAMQVKGIELAAYQPNFNPGYAFALGGPHMTMDTYNGAWYKDSKGSAENTVQEWVDNIIRGPQMILYDLHGLCKFSKVNFDHIANFYNVLYDSNATADDMRNVTKKVHMLGRSIDKRLGFTKDDDTLPKRGFNDILGVVPHFNTKEFFEAVKLGVYKEYEKYDAI